MNPTSLSDVRSLFAEWDYHPNRTLGQNFLIDRNVRDIIIRHGNLSSEDHVLEVGPGLGVLTESLIAEAGVVTAIEKDHRLCTFLRQQHADCSTLNLVEGDALDVDIGELLASGVSTFVSNLPYSVGSRILVDVIRAEHPPQTIVVTVQLEVGQRMVSGPGGKHYGLLSVLCQYSYEAQLVHSISPSCFWPSPAVRSAIVRMNRIQPRHDDARAAALFFALTKHAFMYRRKQLATILSRAEPPLRVATERCHEMLIGMDASATSRPEDLSVEQWCTIASLLVAEA